MESTQGMVKWRLFRRTLQNSMGHVCASRLKWSAGHKSLRQRGLAHTTVPQEHDSTAAGHNRRFRQQVTIVVQDSSIVRALQLQWKIRINDAEVQSMKLSQHTGMRPKSGDQCAMTDPRTAWSDMGHTSIQTWKP
jgi:hypothetical protein